METISFRKLVQDRHVKSFSTLRINENGYPFVTLLGNNSTSMNIYFGKKSAQIVTDNAEEGDGIALMLKDANVIKTFNENGELRYKMSLTQGSNYASTSELEEIFGVEASAGDFDVKEFLQAFSTVATVSQVTQP